jgi:hypothetical protein
MGLHALNEEREEVRTDERPRRRIRGANLGRVYVWTDAAVILRQAAGGGFWSVQTQIDAFGPFATPRWRCPYQFSC